MKFNFTKASVRAIDLPIGTHSDTQQRGLVLNVTATSRRFGVYTSIQNNPTRRSIGPIEEWSCEAARLEAARIMIELREKASAPPQARALTVTLSDLVKDYTKELEKKGRRGPDYIAYVVSLHWSHLDSRPIASITKEELREHHWKVGQESGKSSANRGIAILRTLFHYAVSTLSSTAMLSSSS